MRRFFLYFLFDFFCGCGWLNVAVVDVASANLCMHIAGAVEGWSAKNAYIIFSLVLFDCKTKYTLWKREDLRETRGSEGFLIFPGDKSLRCENSGLNHVIIRRRRFCACLHRPSRQNAIAACAYIHHGKYGIDILFFIYIFYFYKEGEVSLAL